MYSSDQLFMAPIYKLRPWMSIVCLRTLMRLMLSNELSTLGPPLHPSLSGPSGGREWNRDFSHHHLPIQNTERDTAFGFKNHFFLCCSSDLWYYIFILRGRYAKNNILSTKCGKGNTDIFISNTKFSETTLNSPMILYRKMCLRLALSMYKNRKY